MKNTTQFSSSEAHHVTVSSRSEATECSQATSQQSRLSRAMSHEENKENFSSARTLQAMDTTDMSQQDVELRMAEAVFEETARQLETYGGGQSRLSLGSVDLTSDQTADLAPGQTADLAPGQTADTMEIDPDVSPQLAALKSIDKPGDWAGGAVELVKPNTKPAPEPAVVLPALKPISKPTDWTGPQSCTKPSDDDNSEEPKPLVSLKHVNLPPVEKSVSKDTEEPKPLVLLKPVVKPIEHASNKPVADEPKPLVSLKPVPKPPVENPWAQPAAEEMSSPFGTRLTPSRPAGGLRQSQLVQQQQQRQHAVTSEVSEEASGVWGRVSAIRDTFDCGSRSAAGSRPLVQLEKPRAPTMAVPNAFHQMPSAYVDQGPAAAGPPELGGPAEAVSIASMQQSQQSDGTLAAWGDEDEHAYMEPAEFRAGQSADFTEEFGQSEVMPGTCRQSYHTAENVHQSHSAYSSSEFQHLSIGDSTGDWSHQPISGPEGDTDDVMFQCEVALVETTVNQEALQDYLGRTDGQEWLETSDQEPRPSSGERLRACFPDTLPRMSHPHPHKPTGFISGGVWECGCTRVSRKHAASRSALVYKLVLTA